MPKNTARRAIRPGVGSAAVALLASTAGADLVNVDEFRAITARAAVGGEADGPFFLEADPFSDFDATLAALVASSSGGAGASATQTSAFFTDRITAQGSASSSTGGAGPFDTAATSIFQLLFSVDTDTDVTLVRSISGLSTFQLLENGTEIAADSGTDNLTLLAGARYLLVATAGVSLDEAGADGGAYALQLVGVPAPGALAPLAGVGLLAARRRR